MVGRGSTWNRYSHAYSIIGDCMAVEKKENTDIAGTCRYDDTWICSLGIWINCTYKREQRA